MSSHLARIGALLALLAAAGCGQQASPSGPSGKSVPVASSATLPVLAASAVPGIPSVTTPFTAADLAKDAPVHGFAAKIASWGYVAGRQRTFQGESHRLTLVISRALIFRNSAGAQHYVAFVRQHPAAFFGIGVQARHLAARNASGWLFTPPLCACHMANPALIGILNAHSRVIWLEINGPSATPALLARLIGSVGVQ
jgi:hypothetical protein